MAAKMLKRCACEAIDNAADELFELSSELWKNPELADEEFFAHDLLTDYLEKNSFQSVKRKYHLDTAFSATFGEENNGPHVAVMCEYDALPDIGHACGHNLIAEVGIAVGIGLKTALAKSKTKIGKLTVLGTPAEETDGGKVKLINAGAFKDFDVAMMAHPSKYALLKPNYLAIKQFTLDYIGQEAHAAEWPWEGKNALDAAVLCYQNISCFRQQMPPGWMVHGVITNGGARPNIIPGKASLEYYIRCPTDAELKDLNAKIIACAEGAATATGCKLEVKYGEDYQALLTNDVMIELYERNARDLGIEFETDEKIVKKFGGSTDMGNVSQVVPSIHPEFVIGTDYNSHTQEFGPAAGDKKAQSYTIATAKALAMTAIDIYTNPNYLTAIREEFESRTK